MQVPTLCRSPIFRTFIEKFFKKTADTENFSVSAVFIFAVCMDVIFLRFVLYQIYAVPCAILRYAQNDRFLQTVGACVKMPNLYTLCKGGCPHPPEQNPILRKTNDYAPIVGARSRLPARSVLLNILYSKVSTGDPHLGDPPKFYENSRRGQVTASPLPFCLLRRHFP